MRKLNNCIFLIIISTLAANSFAMSSTVQNTSGQQPTQIAAATPAQPTTLPPGEVHYCPLASELNKQDLLWEAGSNWKSFTQSSEQKIKSFTGVQWQGVKVGKVICLYSAEEQNSFPIALEQVISDIILEPSGGNWSALTKGSRLCSSANVTDCPFYVQPKEDISNIYKEIEYRHGTKNN
jgi:hypothetical protein